MGRKESSWSPRYWFNKRVDMRGPFLKWRILDKDQFGKLGIQRFCVLFCCFSKGSHFGDFSLLEAEEGKRILLTGKGDTVCALEAGLPGQSEQAWGVFSF